MLLQASRAGAVALSAQDPAAARIVLLELFAVLTMVLAALMVYLVFMPALFGLQAAAGTEGPWTTFHHSTTVVQVPTNLINRWGAWGYNASQVNVPEGGGPRSYGRPLLDQAGPEDEDAWLGFGGEWVIWQATVAVTVGLWLFCYILCMQAHATRQGVLAGLSRVRYMVSLGDKGPAGRLVLSSSLGEGDRVHAVRVLRGPPFVEIGAPFGRRHTKGVVRVEDGLSGAVPPALQNGSRGREASETEAKGPPRRGVPPGKGPPGRGPSGASRHASDSGPRSPSHSCGSSS